ncbi:serine/threonine-protein kinase [Rathayibacter sp. YIM 133350]|uniref:serine/threonine-protein kinase n=1 Tax=Rathayibacter sp. YIM 133350 TaxID=3131992 RepID=UPI00307EE183
MAPDTTEQFSRRGAPSAVPGALFAGRYRIEARLGSGGMATVFRAHDEMLGRRVALKVFRDQVGDAGDLRRQREEIRTIAALSHPAIVTLYDGVAIEQNDGSHEAFLVMQLVDGVDLKTKLRRQSIGADAAALIGADIADALAYVHARSLVHRDLKPANVLIPDSPETGPVAMLADFGIARLVDGTRLTATGSVIGTANYMSPEQALGQPITPASDIYSLGLVLIECVTGKQSFPGSALESAAVRISADPWVPVEYGEPWAALLRAMTARDPAARPTALEVGERLRAGVASAAGVAVRVTDETGEGTQAYAPTRVLPASKASSAPPTAATELLADPDPATADQGVPHSDSTAPTTPHRPAAGPLARLSLRARVILAAALAVLVIAGGIGIWASTQSPSDAPARVDYPTVDGQLGKHLERLQKSVKP